ncbi:MAG TPA: DUF1844 domain-containing protein [Myxococcota bacterium]|jgi:hypothetical protein
MSDSDARGFTLVDKDGASSSELPKADFSGFLISLGSSAFVHMGLLADPESGKTREPNLAVARQTIDMIELLEEKTRGNLTSDEATLLRNLLTDLRMRFVTASRDAKGA